MAPTDAFDDADELDAPMVSEKDLAGTLAGLFRADVSGTRPGAVRATVASTAPKARMSLLLALSDALKEASLAAWIMGSGARKQRAIEIAREISPKDPAQAHNEKVVATFRSFTQWDRFSYRCLVVPGYTPLDEKVARPGVHPVARRRLEMAVEDHRSGVAPFIFVSGANVYPRGTPYFEAIEMKNELRKMGVPEDRIYVEARARHTTTNLRNCGRIMRKLGVSKALVVTKGGGIGGSDWFGQDFYLAHPSISTFNQRCEHELGYILGELRGVGDGRIDFEVAPTVERPSYDPLDP